MKNNWIITKLTSSSFTIPNALFDIKDIYFEFQSFKLPFIIYFYIIVYIHYICIKYNSLNLIIDLWKNSG